MYDQWWFGWVEDDDGFVFFCVVYFFDGVGGGVGEFINVFVSVWFC